MVSTSDGVHIYKINRSATSKVGVLNPFATEVDLRQDAVIGMAEKVEKIVSVITDAERENEKENFSSIRRIGSVKKKQEDPLSELQKSPENEVSKYLKGLYNKATVGRSNHESQIVACHLSKYGNSFSKDAWDLGLTDLAEYPINTGDAEPV